MYFKFQLVTRLALLLAFAACKKSPGAQPSASEGLSSSSPPPTAGVAPADAAPPANDASRAPAPTKTPTPRPAAFAAFEEVLLPLVGEAESDERSKKTCKSIEKLRIRSLAVQRSMPAGIDAAAWEEVGSDMGGAFDGLGATCTDVPPNDMPDLTVIHRAYLRYLSLLPK